MVTVDYCRRSNNIAIFFGVQIYESEHCVCLDLQHFFRWTLKTSCNLSGSLTAGDNKLIVAFVQWVRVHDAYIPKWCNSDNSWAVIGGSVHLLPGVISVCFTICLFSRRRRDAYVICGYFCSCGRGDLIFLFFAVIYMMLIFRLFPLGTSMDAGVSIQCMVNVYFAVVLCSRGSRHNDFIEVGFSLESPSLGWSSE